jgi:nitrite reductase/ring-hydroxylating ferredoxin subunit
MSEWIGVPNAENMSEGTMTAFAAIDKRIVIYKTRSGYFATDRRCTHQAADLMRGYFDGDVIECPAHQGRFSVCTGAALSAPASAPLTTYPVKIVDGKVFVLV